MERGDHGGPPTVIASQRGPVTIVTISRPAVRNAVDSATAGALLGAFEAFDADQSSSVAVLTGAGGEFCAGADLVAFAGGDPRPVDDHGPGPMGRTRLVMTKPVIAAIEGHAVAGGLELALWCDLRVAAEDAVLGVYCRRVGVPLVDLGTVRLPRLIGHGRAMDLILTGPGVTAAEALSMGLVNRVVGPGTALAEATANEAHRGRAVIASGEALAGARRFAAGTGRGGAPFEPPGTSPAAGSSGAVLR